MADIVETTLNIEAVDFDNEQEIDAFHEAWITTGQAKVQDDFRRLREVGIVDSDGKQLKTVVSSDMLDAGADFCG